MNILYKMSQYFPNPHQHFVGKLSRKSAATGVDRYNVPSKSGLANLILEVDKTDVYKLKTTDSRKPCNVVDKDIVKKLCMIR